MKQYFGTVAVEAEVMNVEHFEVVTPQLAAVVKGTKFIVFSSDDTAKVTVTRGRVAVEDKDTHQTALLSVGQTATTEDGGAPLEVSGKGDLPVVYAANGKPAVVATVEPDAVISPKQAAAEARAAALAGGASAKEAEKAAKEAAKEAEEAAKDATKEAKDAAKDAEHAAKDAAKDAEHTGKDAEKAAREAEKEAEKEAKAEEKSSSSSNTGSSGSGSGGSGGNSGNSDSGNSGRGRLRWQGQEGQGLSQPACAVSPATAAATRTAITGSPAASMTGSTFPGNRIGTAEVESALVAHPNVAEAAVVGYPHDIKGQGIHCYFTLMAGAATPRRSPI